MVEFATATNETPYSAASSSALSEAFRPASWPRPFCASSRAVPPDSIVNGIGTLFAVAPEREPGSVLRQTQQPVRRDAPAFGKENTVGQKRGIVRRKPRRAAERNGKIAQRGGLDALAHTRTSASATSPRPLTAGELARFGQIPLQHFHHDGGLLRHARGVRLRRQ